MTPQVEAEGFRAYEQVRAFERLKSWRLPLSYMTFPLISILAGIATWDAGQTTMAMISFIVAILFAWGVWWYWQRLKARHAKNLQLLAALKGTYGDQLPWVQMENHFAALEQLKQDLAREKAENRKTE